jgi:WD repeat-containing protein 19
LRSAEKIMAQITTPKTHIKYAKAKEKQGQFKEAADAYEKGKDTESLVRLCLEHLQLPQRAFSIVRETRETSSAMDIVKYCFKNSDFRSAIEFLLIAKENEKAIETAREHEMMDALALFLGKDGTRGEYMEIARHYKNKKQLEQAAEYYEKAGQFKEALELFLQVGEKALDKAIDVVGAARNDVLTHTLVDYLMGEHDREPKDPNYIFRLYMALGNFRQAARTAVIIAKQEQEEGNYKSAHKMLLETFKDLESQNIPVTRFACLSTRLHVSPVYISLLRVAFASTCARTERERGKKACGCARVSVRGEGGIDRVCMRAGTWKSRSCCCIATCSSSSWSSRATTTQVLFPTP